MIFSLFLPVFSPSPLRPEKKIEKNEKALDVRTVFGIFSWQGPISLLIMLGLAINTVFLSLGKPQVLRYSILLTCTMVLLYNVGVFSLGGILNEGFAIVSSVIGILRYRKKKETTL